MKKGLGVIAPIIILLVLVSNSVLLFAAPAGLLAFGALILSRGEDKYLK